ncbi:MAG: hypothetical protein QOI03_622, partial [Solirubrobacteraceae bacterium]|nr:hypothetical protein [Solirubrobacteraceae bacterium]
MRSLEQPVIDPDASALRSSALLGERAARSTLRAQIAKLEH